MKILLVFVLGIGILAGALILNYIASLLGLMSWFEFVKEPHKATPLSYLWLFVFYPFGLGIVAYYVLKLIGL